MRYVRAALVVITLSALVPAPLYAGDRPAPARGPIMAAVLRGTLVPAPPPSPPSRKGGWIGAAIGAGGAAAVTYWAAKTYGENEAGGFCEGCFAAWGAWTIPAGALIGALVGSQISHSLAPRDHTRSRQTYIAPVVTRRGGAVSVAVRY